MDNHLLSKENLIDIIYEIKNEYPLLKFKVNKSHINRSGDFDILKPRLYMIDYKGIKFVTQLYPDSEIELHDIDRVGEIWIEF